ncbi:MAG TPA: DUF3352 domain-containing protein [Thermoleophilaceae bacterium]|nr:DUF3352 domain-containing protein [Thermoleophilaceae bacterium]
MRKLILTLAVVSIAVFAALGCGNDNKAASGAAELAPAGSVMYGEATLKPEGDQKAAIDAILAKFPGGGQAGEQLKKLIEQGLRDSEAPISYREDIEPWLGDQAAFFVTGQMKNGSLDGGLFLLATDDEDKSRAAIEKAHEGKGQKKTYKDVEYVIFPKGDGGAAAVLDGYVLIGTEDALKAAIDTSKGGKPLSDDEDYGNAIDKAADERLGLIYVNSPEFLKAAQQGGTPLPGSFKQFFEQPFVATIDADKDGVLVEANIPADLAKAFAFFGQGSDLVTELPADSWLAMAQPDFGKLLDFYVDAFAGVVGGRDVVEQQFKAATGLDLQKDVLDWMGDFGVFVRGASVAELDGALIIETNDEAASGRLIDRLRTLASSQVDSGGRITPLSAPGGGEGFTLRSPDVPKPVHLFQRNGRVVVAYGDQAASDAIDAAEKLGDSAEYRDATQSLDGYDISFYLLMQPIFDLVDSTGAASDAGWQKAKPYLEPLSALVGGTSGDGDSLRSAVKLVVK